VVEGRVDPPFDASRLEPYELELWYEHCASPESEDSMTIRVWGFGQICVLDGTGVPDAVSEYLAERDPRNLIRQYVENVRRMQR
jgi:hypothetical protein